MKIIVTGGLGFIGSNFIINQIKKTDNHILNIDKITYAGNIKNLSEIERNKNYSFLKSDICSKNIIEKAFDEFRPDCIINFAAESHVDRSIENPMEFVETNVVGTVNLLQCSTDYYRKGNNKKFRFLHVSTDEVFGSLESSGYFTEHTPYDPSSPYSASKAASDHFVRSWNRTFNLPTIITNCSNNYGPRQFPEKLIPLMVINCLNEKSLPVYGSGDNIRDWLYVSDHCDAIYEALTKGKIGETYNIGSNKNLNNIQITKMLIAIAKKKNLIGSNSKIHFVKDRPGHDIRYALNSKKIKKKLKWSSKININDGLEKTFSWYVKNIKYFKDLKKKDIENRLGKDD